MIGRKPKPTALKRMAGNPGKRRMNEYEPDPPRYKPRCPSHLSDEAKKEWRRISKELYYLGLLSKLDRAFLAAYCQVYARWVKAEQKISEEGEVFITEKGFPMQSPWVSIANKAMDLMNKFGSEFGMSPSSRTRVQATQPKEKSLAELLFEGFDDSD